MYNLKKLIDAAVGREKAELVLKNGWIIDVFTQNIYKGDIAIVDDRIVGVGTYSGENEMDCSGNFLTPAFIDSHVHVESSKVTPEVFSNILIRKGVAACIADPHEIANVLGRKGIEFMIENSRKGMVDIFFMMPSCVPAVEFEDNGAALFSNDLKDFLERPEILGLGEVMDVPAVIDSKKEMLEKLYLFKDKVIDGHCPQISCEWLNGYILSGVRTDHECSTYEDAVEKVKRGMYVMLREGSAAKNLKNLLAAVNEKNFHRFLFCTDDKDIRDIEREGSIDHNIRLSIKNGLNPVKAITIATLNAAQCYGLRGRGAIAPGYKADIAILKDIKDVEIKDVVKNGRLYANKKYEYSSLNLESSINMDFVNEEIFKIKARSGKINVIKVIRDSIETKKAEREAIVNSGYIQGIKSDDVLKVGVFERHKRTGRFSLGFIEGLGIKNCAVAQSISHDSHNIIAAGDSDTDMKIAVNRVIELNGGIVLVSSEKIIGEISLPIGGLMVHDDPETVIQKLNNINEALKRFKKYEDMDIFLTLSFMALPVIPQIKITTRGLYDFYSSRFISLFVDEN